MEPVSAKVQASVSINPNRSQTFLVSLVVLAAILAGGAAYLNDTPLGWAFFGLTAFVFGAASLGWWKSQADVDSENAHPTNLALPQGGAISADARTIRDPQAIQHVLQIVDALMARQPLPDADGLIDDRLKLIPNSKERAQAVTKTINSDTQAATNDLLDALKLSESGDTVSPVLLDAANNEP